MADGNVGFISSAHVCEFGRKKFFTRDSVIRVAEKFIGQPYFWGGRSFYCPALHKKDFLTGVDCATLVEFCYAVNGIKVPRNSKSQYEKSVKKRRPKRGDLIFVSTHGDKDTIKHVMIYIGGDSFIDAKGDFLGKPIRKIVRGRGTDRLGKDIRLLKSGDKIKEGTVLFGSFL